MMNENIVLNKNPKIEFQFLDNGFRLLDEKAKPNSGFYLYNNIESVDLSKTWFPIIAKGLRIFTWIFNGVPFFPDEKSCKKAKIIIRFRKLKVGIWLTDSTRVDKAKKLKALLDRKRHEICSE